MIQHQVLALRQGPCPACSHGRMSAAASVSLGRHVGTHMMLHRRVSRRRYPSKEPQTSCQELLLHLSGSLGGEGLAQTLQGSKSSPGESMPVFWAGPTESVLGNKELLGLLHPDPKLPVRTLSELQTRLVLEDPGYGTSIGAPFIHRVSTSTDAGQEQLKVGMGRRKS